MSLRIGILTGGGDCPGLNAVIRAVSKSLINQCGASIWGIQDGFAGLMSEEANVRPLDWSAVSGITHRGGTILGTSNRANPLKDEESTARVVKHIRRMGWDVLVVVGGDGTVSLAHGLAPWGVKVVGVPKTIDNDIVHCDRSFGFDTAVGIATDSIQRIETTAMSHSRVMIVETMGRYAGWLALEAGMAAAADIILLPEIDHDLDEVIRICQKRETRQRYTIICMGEGAKASGGSLTVRETVDSAPEAVRLGGAAHVLARQLQPHLRSEVRATVLGHVQRGGAPSPFDRVLATRFGHHAAKLIQNGQFDQMVCLQGDDLVSVPISEVAGQQRLIDLAHPMLTMARDIGVSLGTRG